ncbi:MAG: hypothetical protein HYY85_20625 [Deltaproteobacteria bacterium]|nr:hypothetical protein [Deltaproteobacteria bacterium]
MRQELSTAGRSLVHAATVAHAATLEADVSVTWHGAYQISSTWHAA